MLSCTLAIGQSTAPLLILLENPSPPIFPSRKARECEKTQKIRKPAPNRLRRRIRTACCNQATGGLFPVAGMRRRKFSSLTDSLPSMLSDAHGTFDKAGGVPCERYKKLRERYRGIVDGSRTIRWVLSLIAHRHFPSNGQHLLDTDCDVDEYLDVSFRDERLDPSQSVTLDSWGLFHANPRTHVLAKRSNAPGPAPVPRAGCQRSQTDDPTR